MRRFARFSPRSDGRGGRWRNCRRIGVADRRFGTGPVASAHLVRHHRQRLFHQSQSAGDTFYGADVYVHPDARGIGVGACCTKRAASCAAASTCGAFWAGGRLWNYPEHPRSVARGIRLPRGVGRSERSGVELPAARRLHAARGDAKLPARQTQRQSRQPRRMAQSATTSRPPKARARFAWPACSIRCAR